MEIILQEDIEKLGHRGDIVTVKPGYARNFLLPRKMAIAATSGNMKALERIRTLPFKPEALEGVLYRNADRLLRGLGCY